MRSLVCLFVGFCFSLLCSGFAVPRAGAQTATAPTSPPAVLQQTVVLALKAQSLTSLMNTLADKTGVSFLMDDEPSLPPVDFEFTGSAKDALDKIADAFDYTWTQNKRGVVLLRKRFHDRTQYPQTNLPEMRQMARETMDALSILPAGTEQKPWGRELVLLVQNCTPAQMQTLYQQKPLRYADLLPSQQEQLTHILFNRRYATMIRAWRGLLDTLEALPRAHLEKREAAVPPPGTKRPSNAPPPQWDFVYAWLSNGFNFAPVLRQWPPVPLPPAPMPVNDLLPSNSGN